MFANICSRVALLAAFCALCNLRTMFITLAESVASRTASCSVCNRLRSASFSIASIRRSSFSASAFSFSSFLARARARSVFNFSALTLRFSLATSARFFSISALMRSASCASSSALTNAASTMTLSSKAFLILLIWRCMCTSNSFIPAAVQPRRNLRAVYSAWLSA